MKGYRESYNDLQGLAEIGKEKQISWKPEQLTPKKINSSNPEQVRLECFHCIRSYVNVHFDLNLWERNGLQNIQRLTKMN